MDMMEEDNTDISKSPADKSRHTCLKGTDHNEMKNTDPDLEEGKCVTKDSNHNEPINIDPCMSEYKCVTKDSNHNEPHNTFVNLAIISEDETSECSTPSPPLRAHESAVEFGTFAYKTLPNSAPVDRWHHLRTNIRARAQNDESGSELHTNCLARVRERRLMIWLILTLFVVLVISTTTLACLWRISSKGDRSDITDSPDMTTLPSSPPAAETATLH